MAVLLEKLYKDIYMKYDVKLQTSSCFGKQISWLHVIENFEFVSLLHGDELVFNSTLNDASDDERKEYIAQLLEADVSGLMVSLQDGCEFSQDLIDYCNQLQFPLFRTTWNTPFINIMRRFSEIILDSERREMNFIAAFKNAIHHPSDTSLYLNFLEENGFSDLYTVAILNFDQTMEEQVLDSLKQIQNRLQRSLQPSVIFEEKDSLIVIIGNDSLEYLLARFEHLQRSYPGLCLAIGSTESQIPNIHRSYQNAQTTMGLIHNGICQNPFFYDELGSYQILADVKEPDTIFPDFVQNTLGKLMEHDLTNRTKYMSVLRAFFENDCSIILTADALFYHQNTLKYKIKHIKEILGYDIMTNENRVKIMLSLYILNMRKDGM